MKKKLMIVLSAIIGVVAIIFVINSFNNKQTITLDKYKNMSVKEIVDELDRTNPIGFSACISGEILTLSDGNEFEVLELPQDEFYLSFAPYINSTHPCSYHNLITCRGELVNKEIHVKVVDELGNVILEDDVTTFNNGFVGIWLPRNVEATITVTYKNLEASAPITTYLDSETCLTTPLQLQ